MQDMDVRIVELEPMRVAFARAVSSSPEKDAWATLEAWAEKNGLLDDPGKLKVFGFNNPKPFPGKSDYGYEMWIELQEEFEPEEDIGIKDFEGGLYASTTCDDLKKVGKMWKKLWDWCQASEYKWRKHFELEHLDNPKKPKDELIVDLYLPIK